MGSVNKLVGAEHLTAVANRATRGSVSPAASCQSVMRDGSRADRTQPVRELYFPNPSLLGDPRTSRKSGWETAAKGDLFGRAIKCAMHASTFQHTEGMLGPAGEVDLIRGRRLVSRWSGALAPAHLAGSPFCVSMQMCCRLPPGRTGEHHPGDGPARRRQVSAGVRDPALT